MPLFVKMVPISSTEQTEYCILYGNYIGKNWTTENTIKSHIKQIFSCFRNEIGLRKNILSFLEIAVYLMYRQAGLWGFAF
jgi:hypothetical protein